MLSVRVWMVNNTKCFPICLTQSPMSASKLHSQPLNFTLYISDLCLELINVISVGPSF